ncbi:hypothetical protein [Microbacterium sp. A84]|uniref:hypothetical protein n=1 Tax=Microbacterium sp. A84 TaxID=3450715 RepID=UPI003F43B17D
MEPVRFARMTPRRLEDLTLGTLYLTTRKRNAWHSTRVSHYRGETSLKSTWNEAAQAAEQWRKQGSEFVILEVPAVILHSEERRGAILRVAITEFHSHNSFERWDLFNARLLSRGMRLGGAFIRLGHPAKWTGEAPSEQSFVSGFLGDNEVVKRVTTKPKRWHSYPQGSDFLLGWQEQRGEYSPKGVQRIRRAFLEQNRVTAGD